MSNISGFCGPSVGPMSNNPFSEMPMLVSGRVCNSDLPHLVTKDVAGVEKDISN